MLSQTLSQEADGKCLGADHYYAASDDATFETLAGRFDLVRARRSVAGSAIGGIRDTQEVLDFCAEHHIGAEIETVGVDDVNGADDRVVDSDVRYRFVIDTATFGCGAPRPAGAPVPGGITGATPGRSAHAGPTARSVVSGEAPSRYSLR